MLSLFPSKGNAKPVPPLRVALVADLAEPVRPDALSNPAVFAFECASALKDAAHEIGGLSIDLIARRGSWNGLPLISLDPAEAPAADRRLAEEALFTHFVLAGMLRDYSIVHCTAPLITPALILLSQGIRVLHTWTVPPDDPAAALLPKLAARAAWRSATPVARADREIPYIPPPVDTERFRPRPTDAPPRVFAPGATDVREEQAAAVAAELGLVLRTRVGGDPADDLNGAAVVLDLAGHSALPSMWGLRALACGVLAAGWTGGPVEELAAEPDTAALASPGNTGELACRIRALMTAPEAAARRRRVVLRRHSRRAIAAQYFDLYRQLVGVA
jgi:glycosyltransferase involved in cell wall biosynthesis